MSIIKPAPIALLLLSGSALASDRSDAIAHAHERVVAAQQALAAAQTELAAAQAEASEYTSTSTTTSSSQPTEPDTKLDTEEAVEATKRLAWNEGWEYSFIAGLSGASGNSENFAGRLSLTGERNTDAMETHIFANYRYDTSDSQKSASRGELGIHNDWLLEGPWRYFAQAKYEYDEFQAWQHRLSAALGVGYEFIKNDKNRKSGV